MLSGYGQYKELRQILRRYSSKGQLFGKGTWQYDIHKGAVGYV